MQIQISWLLQKPTDLDIHFAKVGHIRDQQDRVEMFLNIFTYCMTWRVSKIKYGKYLFVPRHSLIVYVVSDNLHCGLSTPAISVLSLKRC